MSTKANLKSQISSKLNRAASASSSAESSVESDDVVIAELGQILGILKTKNQEARVPMEVSVCMHVISTVMAKYMVWNMTATTALMKLGGVKKVIIQADDTELPEVDPSRAEFFGVKQGNMRKAVIPIISTLGGIMVGSAYLSYRMTTNRLQAMYNTFTILNNALTPLGGKIGAAMISSRYGIDLHSYAAIATGKILKARQDISYFDHTGIKDQVLKDISMATPESLYREIRASEADLDQLQFSSEILEIGAAMAPDIIDFDIKSITEGWDEILRLEAPSENLQSLALPYRSVTQDQDIQDNYMLSKNYPSQPFTRAYMYSKAPIKPKVKSTKEVCGDSKSCALFYKATQRVRSVGSKATQGIRSVGSTVLGWAAAKVGMAAPSLVDSQKAEDLVVSASQAVGTIMRIEGTEYHLSNLLTEKMAAVRTIDTDARNFFDAFKNSMRQLNMITEDIETSNTISDTISMLFMFMFFLIFFYYASIFVSERFLERNDASDEEEDEKSYERMKFYDRMFARGDEKEE
jgi:hypothetical protein